MHFSCPFCGCQNEALASGKWWSEGTGLLQMVIRRGRPLKNDHLEGSSSKRRNWGFQNSWAFICFLREKYTLGEESIIFYVWSHAQSKVYNVKITKPKVKRRLRTRSPLRRYPASFSCDAGKGTKLRKRNLLSCKHIAVVYSYFFCVISSDYFCYWR